MHGHILHGDVCEINVMWQRTLNGRVIAILHDWDISSSTPDSFHSNNTTVATCIRIGTGPSLAVRLQQAAGESNRPPERRHHHDLESLFWLLVRAVLHFDLDNKRRLKTKLPRWEGGWAAAAQEKKTFLKDAEAFVEVMKHALPLYRGLITPWVVRLMRIFRRAYDAAMIETFDAGGDFVVRFDEEIYAEEISFERFLHAIEEEEGREKAMKRLSEEQ
ncbi:hypothetical protein HDZ31DRAFT_63233 [Schizophyllum fasciatum]